ncbi:hypothetical protein ACOTD7_07765, partial [Achromobacter xylosoxidans]
FVQAFGLPFRFRRAHLHAPPATGRRPTVLAIALVPALLGRVVCLAFLWRECLSPKILRGPPKGGRPGGLFWAYMVFVRWRMTLRGGGKWVDGSPAL